ncbi:MAG: phosphoribosyl-AMP cyclohydrolase [Oscillospiraceae bacterium]|jgi:phosphoribosyl-AMP cyclohydrolase|nr:phosphoribosyl-AMP cyclohydrolase [Oscillospiraceae bacterium]
MQLDELFTKSDLIPCIVQEDATGEVLMLAYMNRESLAQTLALGETVFWSRSRQELWHKGATSGHVQRIVSLHADCDSDTLLARVVQTGAACHTGAHSCFFKAIV